MPIAPLRRGLFTSRPLVRPLAGILQAIYNNLEQIRVYVITDRVAKSKSFKTRNCVFRPIVTTRFGNVTGDFGIVTDRSGIVTAGVWRV